MRLRPPAIEVPCEDPFRFDLLERKENAAMLAELVKSASDPLVIGIDAEWGSGKSTFLRMWMQHLENEGLKKLYFNAWESDFSDDAFVSIVGELELGMSELNEAHGKKAKKALERAKKVGLKLIKRTIPTAVKIATAGALDMNEYTEAALADIGEKLAEEKIKSYEAAKQSVAGFKATLSDFANELTSKNESEKAPLVIVIDELDRCRPSYAIDVLENIKHFFSVPGIVFVIAADWTQLANVVKTRYGIEAEVNGYLRRFVDITFVLTATEGDKFIDAQFEKFELMKYLSTRQGRESQYDYQQLKELFFTLFQATNSSYRDQERCFSLLSLAIRSTPQNMRLYALYLSVLIVLKVKNPSLYKTYTADPSLYDKVFEYFKLNTSGRKYFEDDGGYGPIVEAYLVKEADDVDGRHSGVHLQRLKDRSVHPDTSESEKIRLKRVIELIGHFSFRDHHRILGYLQRKIDFVSGLKT